MTACQAGRRRAHVLESGPGFTLRGERWQDQLRQQKSLQKVLKKCFCDLDKGSRALLCRCQQCRCQQRPISTMDSSLLPCARTSVLITDSHLISDQLRRTLMHSTDELDPGRCRTAAPVVEIMYIWQVEATQGVVSATAKNLAESSWDVLSWSKTTFSKGMPFGECLISKLKYQTTLRRKNDC